MPPQNHSVETAAAPIDPAVNSTDASTSSSSSSTFPTLIEIKRAIPAKYFQASVWWSIYYVFRTTAFILALGFAVHALTAESSSLYISSSWIRSLVWIAYWWTQGTVFWGVFTLGHDCGHGSFSKYKVVNQLFGCVLHSFLLVPYESWKLTHNHHHKHTGDIDNDEIFYPHRTNTLYDEIRRAVVSLMGPAWFIYLYGRRHFYPVQGDNIFRGHENDVVVSHSFWLAMVFALYHVSGTLSFAWLAAYYFAPLVVFASWLVITTFLHHSDPDTPWYAGTEWNYVKGNLSSIDRSYGYGINNVIHNIGTHQIHHLFPIIPHYYLVDATAHFRTVFPHLVRESNESIFGAFFRNWIWYYRYGHSVPKDAAVFSYRSAANKTLKSQ